MTREEAIERLKQNKAAAEFYAGTEKSTSVIENELKDIEAFNMAIEALSEPKTEWISVSKKLPERSVLCCDGHGEFIIGFLAYEDDQFICENENEIMYDPIAWMPLPEPYREDGEHEPI